MVSFIRDSSLFFWLSSIKQGMNNYLTLWALLAKQVPFISA